MSDRATVAQLFIRMQQYRERCWRAHIAKKHREALELATMMQLCATELVRALADEQPVP